MTPLSDSQLERYARHVILDEVGEAGQEKLLASSVLLLGAGGLGSPMLLYLAAAGVGRIGIVDDDSVELSNLQRGDRIAQLVIAPVARLAWRESETLPESTRGAGGFGSTGRR